MSVRTLIFAGVCSLVPLSGLSSAADAPESQRYAFLVGVNDYGTHKDDRLANLSFCVADMKSFQEKLEEIGFKRVYCLTTESTFSQQPTKARVEERFCDLGMLDSAGTRSLGDRTPQVQGRADRHPAEGRSEQAIGDGESSPAGKTWRFGRINAHALGSRRVESVFEDRSGN